MHAIDNVEYQTLKIDRLKNKQEEQIGFGCGVGEQFADLCGLRTAARRIIDYNHNYWEISVHFSWAYPERAIRGIGNKHNILIELQHRYYDSIDEI